MVSMKLEKFQKVAFEEAMDDDFNTANAISELFELSKASKSIFDRKTYF